MTDKSGMLAAVAAAAGLDASAPVNVTADLVAEHFPAVAADLRAAGAKAERERLAGIEAQALPGHESIIAAMKADASKTGADAAMAILAAEKQLRANQLTAFDADEAKVKGLRSQPANGVEPPPADKPKADADWRAQGFASEADFKAWQDADDRGAIRVLRNRAAS